LLTYLLYAVFILSCVVLVVAVLLQPGKADAGALFTSSVSSTAFGPRGTQSVLAKITIFAAASFLLTALLLTAGVGRGGSLMDDVEVPAATPTPAAAASPEAGAAQPAASPQGETAAPSPAASAAAPSPAASPQAGASPATK